MSGSLCWSVFLRNLGALAIFLCLTVSPLLAKRKDDRVVLKNGDRITGEIKRIERGTALLQTRLRIGRHSALTGPRLSGWRARTTSRLALPMAPSTPV